MSTASNYFRPLSKISVAECLLEYLKLEGIHNVFALPGAAAKNIMNELKNQSGPGKWFKQYICRHETGAAFLAHGYSCVTGKLGVVLVTSGPGATNALTGTMNAQNGNAAVLTITGEVPEVFFGRGYLQEGVDANLDINAIYRNASQYSAIVTAPENFPTLFSQCLRETLSQPPKAAHISIPDDIAGQCMKPFNFPLLPQNYRTVPHCADWENIKTALEILAKAERPVIFLGNGCRRALTDPTLRKPSDKTRLRQFIELVDRYAIPVMTTLEGKALFPETHPLALRNYGLAACQWPRHYLLKDPVNPTPYDALLVLGSSLQSMATDRWDKALIPNGPFMQVDLDHRVIGRDFPLAFGIIAELGVAIEDLIKIGTEVIKPIPRLVEARRKFLKNLKKKVPPYAEPLKRKSTDSPIRPQALMRCISDGLPAQSHVFVDAGNCVGWCMHYLEVNPPAQVHCTLDMGPMGFAVGAVIGAKIGAPKSTCVAITGDGAFLMHGTEVSTAAQYDIGAITIVLADNDLLMVSQGMNYFYHDPNAWNNYYPLGNVDLLKFSEALGATAYAVHSPADMDKAFAAAIKAAKPGRNNTPRPQVIVVHIDTKEMPPYYPNPAPPHVPCSQQPSNGC
jgi:acetolactate synthase-1/2/3 large subunit